MADWKSELYRQAKSIGKTAGICLLVTLLCVVVALECAAGLGVRWNVNVGDDNSSAPSTIWGALSGEEE